MIYLSANPSEKPNLGLLYYQFFLDKNNYYGTPVTDNHFADEINLYSDWTINDYASVSTVYGVAFPCKAAKQAFGQAGLMIIFGVILISEILSVAPAIVRGILMKTLFSLRKNAWR